MDPKAHCWFQWWLKGQKGHIGSPKEHIGSFKEHIGSPKGHIGSLKEHSGLWKRPTENPALPAYNIMTSSAVGTEPVTKCKNSISPLDLLPLCLSSTKFHSPSHNPLLPYRMSLPTDNKPPFKLNKLLCSVHTVNWEYHPFILLAFFQCTKGRQHFSVSTNIPATNSISVSIYSTSS